MSSHRLLNVGVVGATGMVGQEFIKILDQRKFPISDLKLFASEKSKGSTITFRNNKYEIDILHEGCFKGLDVVFFSAGGSISKDWAPKAVSDGAYAIDNSSAFRMNPEVPLIVPEVNGNLLEELDSPALIANPNCSTIQMVVALKPIQKQFGLKAVKVATYQAVSGAGKKGVDELTRQTHAVMNHKKTTSEKFPHQIAYNCLPQIGDFDETGFCTEETKMMNETCKILEQEELSVSAFTVRVPALNSHSEAVWVTTDQTADEGKFLSALRNAPGLKLMDDSNYPHAVQASGLDPVYVGRVRQDLKDPKTWLMWVVADNIRKGAALNGLQIAEQIFKVTPA